MPLKQSDRFPVYPTGAVIHLIVLLLVTLLMLQAGFAATATNPDLSAAESRLDESFNGVIEASKAQDRIYQRAFGMADFAAQQPNTPQMRFRIGSITKTFTAAIVVQLAEAGDLSLDDPVGKFITGIPNGDRITLFDLVEHRSGLRDFSQDDWKVLLLSESPLTRSDILQRIADKKPRREPGEKFEYNNAGYLLLGFVVEDVTQKSLASAFEVMLLEPLGLADTGVKARDGEIENLSTGHDRKLREDPADYDYSTILAAGGLYSTASDLLRWCEQQSVNPERLGWRRGERFGREAAWHPGNINDYSALLVQFPEVEGCYAVVSNVGRSRPPKDMLRTIPDALFGKEE